MRWRALTCLHDVSSFSFALRSDTGWQVETLEPDGVARVEAPGSYWQGDKGFPLESPETHNDEQHPFFPKSVSNCCFHYFCRLGTSPSSNAIVPLWFSVKWALFSLTLEPWNCFIYFFPHSCQASQSVASEFQAFYYRLSQKMCSRCQKEEGKKKSAHPREQHMLIAGSLSTYPRLEQMATSRLFSRPSPNMLMRRDGRCVWEERISGSVYLSLLVWLDWFLSWRAISISPINDNLIHISTHGVPCSTGGTCPK